jgi:DNA-binding response OmpR family regulator
MSATDVHRAIARILLVEDEDKLRASLAEGLELEDWHVATAATGAEATRLIESEPFDLLVLDYMLPDYDGIEVVRQARAHHLNTPVLMITAHPAALGQLVEARNGAIECLAKPFAFGDLVDRCRALLERQAANSAQS